VHAELEFPASYYNTWTEVVSEYTREVYSLCAR